jgi:hypothetical protein
MFLYHQELAALLIKREIEKRRQKKGNKSNKRSMHAATSNIS